MRLLVQSGTLCAIFCAGGPAPAQTPVPELLAGRVVNALTGAPIPRVLVRVSGHAQLTDQEGRFYFEQPGQAASVLRVTRPGFLVNPEQADGTGDELIQTGDPASETLALWPEAILRGTVTGPDGEPLPRINVLVRRSVFDEQGLHSQLAGQKQTDVHGQFRFPLPAGDYAVQIPFSARGYERNEAVLPTSFPLSSSGDVQGTFHLTNGEDRQIDLRAHLSNPHIVSLPIDVNEDGPPPRITARSQDGSTFSTSSVSSSDPGVYRFSLPRGTYALRATRFGRNGTQFGDATVTVTDRDTLAAPMHFASLPNVAVDVILDSSATVPAAGVSHPLPTAMQLNLVLEPADLEATSPFGVTLRPVQQRDGTISFAAPPGTYRLRAGNTSGWYVEQAVSRGTDLLRELLTISPGSSPPPITITINNRTGALQGVTTLTGAPASCWVYLVASIPALPPVFIRQSDTSGAFHLQDLPPGDYSAIAFPYRHFGNLQETQLATHLVTYRQSVAITSASSSQVNLTCVPPGDLHP